MALTHFKCHHLSTQLNCPTGCHLSIKGIVVKLLATCTSLLSALSCLARPLSLPLALGQRRRHTFLLFCTSTVVCVTLKVVPLIVSAHGCPSLLFATVQPWLIVLSQLLSCYLSNWGSIILLFVCAGCPYFRVAISSTLSSPVLTK